MKTTETVTTANAANAATEAHMSQTSTVPQILSRETFGPASRYELQEFLGRDGSTTWFVLDAEQVDEVTGGPKVIRQSATKLVALEGFGPWCARCEKTFDHGCNTAYCSLECEDADQADGNDANGYVVEVEATSAEGIMLQVAASNAKFEAYEVPETVKRARARK
jgi:hypothetical protein